MVLQENLDLVEQLLNGRQRVIDHIHGVKHSIAARYRNLIQIRELIRGQPDAECCGFQRSYGEVNGFQCRKQQEFQRLVLNRQDSLRPNHGLCVLERLRNKTKRQSTGRALCRFPKVSLSGLLDINVGNGRLHLPR